MNDLAVRPEEAALVEALRRGDEDAFARLVGEHHASLRRVARLYVANAPIADEVVQDAWLGVIQGIWAFEGRSSLKTWIFRILVNRARTRAVRESRGARFIEMLATEAGAASESSASPELPFPVADPSDLGRGAHASPDSSPEGRLLTKELRERLGAFIDALAPNLKVVLWLRDVEGWSSEEVCNALA